MAMYPSLLYRIAISAPAAEMRRPGDNCGCGQYSLWGGDGRRQSFDRENVRSRNSKEKETVQYAFSQIPDFGRNLGAIVRQNFQHPKRLQFEPKASWIAARSVTRDRPMLLAR